MRIQSRLAATILIAGTAIATGPAHAAEARKKPPRNPGIQIACTRAGCQPIPRGCVIEIERNWDGLPTGYDLVVCPYR